MPAARRARSATRLLAFLIARPRQRRHVQLGKLIRPLMLVDLTTGGSRACRRVALLGRSQRSWKSEPFGHVLALGDERHETMRQIAHGARGVPIRAYAERIRALDLEQIGEPVEQLSDLGVLATKRQTRPSGRSCNLLTRRLDAASPALAPRGGTRVEVPSRRGRAMVSGTACEATSLRPASSRS